MAEKKINTRLILRNDTLENWGASQKGLLKGEAALAKIGDNTFEMRVGVDGVKTWSDIGKCNLIFKSENISDILDTISEKETNTSYQIIPVELSSGETGTSFQLQSKEKGAKEWVDVAGSRFNVPAFDPSTLQQQVTDISVNLDNLSSDFQYLSGTVLPHKYSDLCAYARETSSNALNESKRYTNEVSGALSDVVVADYVKYSDVNGGKDALLNENKIATIKDIAGLSGVTHFRGTFVNAESGKTDKQAFYDRYKPVAKGDIAINTSNGKEYLAIETLPADATAEQISAGIVELGDERLYATKSELQVETQRATAAEGIISAAVDKLSGEYKTFLSTTYVSDKEEISAAIFDLSDEFDGKLAAEVAARANADSELCTKIEDAVVDVKKYVDNGIAQEVKDRNTAISAAIGTLDVTDTAVAKQFVTAVSETDGKITVTRSELVSSDIPALEYDALGAAAKALADAKTYADTQDGALHTTITGEIATAKGEAISTVVGTDADPSTESTVKGAKKYTDEKVAALQDKALTGVTLNGQPFKVENHVATFSIDVIDCGGAL